MIIDNTPTISVTNVMSDQDQNVYSVVPNFLLINQPTVKALETKVKKTKKLIVWFDIRNEHDHFFNPKDIYPSIVLENFKFQLTDSRKGELKALKNLNNKEKDGINNLDKLEIKHDATGNVVNYDNSFVYELDADNFHEDLSFNYKLSFINRQAKGLTKNGAYGSSEGTISIKNKEVDSSAIVFNNAIAHLENNQQQNVIINQTVLDIKKSRINRLHNVNSPLLEISAINDSETITELTKSERISPELARISHNGINYLQTDNKTIKTVQNGDSFKVYKANNNHYDFQTNKWVDDSLSKLSYFDEKDMKLSFEYNHQKFDIDLDIKELNINIKVAEQTDKKLIKLSSYKNVKPNTKFNTFIRSRNR